MAGSGYNMGTVALGDRNRFYTYLGGIETGPAGAVGGVLAGGLQVSSLVRVNETALGRSVKEA